MGDDREATRISGLSCCTDLGGHAASAERARAVAGHPDERIVVGARTVDQPRIRDLPRVGVVNTGLVGQNDQAVGIQQVDDQRRQRVVIPHANFIDRDRIVFIDDRHNSEAQQRGQRTPSIEITGPVGHVLEVLLLPHVRDESDDVVTALDQHL